VDGISDQQIHRFMELSLIYYGCFFALGVFLWLSLLDRMSFVRCVLMVSFTIGCFINIQSKGAFAIWMLAVVAIALSVRFNSLLSANPQVAYLARVLGLTAYPLYLWHNAIGAALIGFLFRSGVDEYTALIVAISFVVSASLAIAVSVEPKLQKWLKSKMEDMSGRFAVGGSLTQPVAPPFLATSCAVIENRGAAASRAARTGS
jgi:peptidoglycan/LPS O-acetylase OafA/YrhL